MAAISQISSQYVASPGSEATTVAIIPDHAHRDPRDARHGKGPGCLDGGSDVVERPEGVTVDSNSVVRSWVAHRGTCLGCDLTVGLSVGTSSTLRCGVTGGQPIGFGAFLEGVMRKIVISSVAHAGARTGARVVKWPAAPARIGALASRGPWQ